ncbi:hypothetical protein [Streptomyces sp. NPDC005805]|uniref:hypothetical protein n=1 Tax=Streptomyces sp. NPDC005805 TaxID=3157068 RepID=UPI0033F90C7E
MGAGPMSPHHTEPGHTAPPPAPVRHPALSELRRGLPPWAGLAVFLTLAVALGQKAERWQGSWGETQSLLHSAASLLCVPLALAAGCLQGGRERRRRTDELRAATPRGPLAQFLTTCLPLVAWIAAGYTVAHGAALLATLPYASAGHPLPGPVVEDLVALAAATAVGQVAGRVVTWRLAAPVLAALAYAVQIAPAYGSGEGGARFLSPASSLLADTVTPVWWQPLVLALWTGGLGTAAVLAHAARRRATALLPLAAALTAATVVVQSGEGMWRPDPLANRQVCDTTVRPHICVNALYPGVLPQATEALSGVTTRLDGVGNLPARFEDLPREPGPDEAQLPTFTPIGWSLVRGRLTDPARYAWEGAAALTARHCLAPDRPSGAELRVMRTDTAVTDWLAPSPLGIRIEEDALRWGAERGDREAVAAVRAERAARARLDAMPDEERRAWLTRYFATAGECSPRSLKEVPVL